MAAFDEYAYLEQQVEQAKAQADGGGGKAAGEEGGKEREREREREGSRRESGGHKESSRSRHKSRERDRDRGKSRDRDRDRDRERGKSRDRDRDRDRRRSDDRHRSSSRRRSRSRERRRSSHDRVVKLQRREPTPPEERERRERERELMELDRDIRTIFAYNLPLKASEKELFQFFSAAGKIADVRIITDRSTRRSKGFAYIEFANREDIVKAMGLTGQLLMGQAVMVKSAEAEKNLAWEAAQAQAASVAQLGALQGGGGPCKLLVSNLHPNIGEGDLRQIFEPFGLVESVTVQREPGSRPQCTGFVQYASAADANKALTQLDRMDIAGQQIGVKVAPLAPGEAPPPPPAPGAPAAAPGDRRMDLDEEDGEGMRMNTSARVALMSRLAGGAGGPPQGLPPPPAAPAGPVMSAPAQALALEQGVLGPSSPRPTQCLLLKNMFDPAQETEPEWDKDIAEDVKEECAKYGAVNHVFVDRNSKGFVYLRFDSLDGAVAAQKALHGRWFAGKQVVAEFQFVAPYVSYFRC